jgi:hypothetical protein
MPNTLTSPTMNDKTIGQVVKSNDIYDIMMVAILVKIIEF